MKYFIALCLSVSFCAHSLTGLKEGASVPSLIFEDTSGKKIDLRNLKRPTALVFYRGAWCPYCVKQLKSIEEELVPKTKNKADIIGISVDSLKEAKKMKDKMGISYTIVSDPKARSLKAFKIVNQLDDELVEKYKSAYKIDVEASSGEDHHLVAHPAVFIIKDGKITYRDVHTNYKERTKNQEILKALSL